MWKKIAWLFFAEVASKFLGNTKDSDNKTVVDLIINYTGFEPRSQSYSLSSFRYCVIFFDSCKTVSYCSFAIDILLDLFGEKRLR